MGLLKVAKLLKKLHNDFLRQLVGSRKSTPSICYMQNRDDTLIQEGLDGGSGIHYSLKI